MTAKTARGLVKRKLAELRQREQQKAGIQKTIAAIDGEIERAVEDHGTQAAPIQKKLRSLEQEIVTALTSSGPVAVLENQRDSARDTLDKLNIALQEKTTKLNDRRALLETELSAPELNTTALSTIESRLVDTAPQELHDLKHSVDCEIQWLERRRNHASARLFDHENSLESTTSHFDDESRDILQRRVSRWQLEFNLRRRSACRSHKKQIGLT